MNLNSTRNAISSLESESGVTRSVKPDGPMIAPSGQALALVNLSPRQAKEQGRMMSGTYGPLGSISSASASLRLSLVNRLKQLSGKVGSTLYKLTWKESVTPLGRPVSLLRASALHTSGQDFTSWPTPQTFDATNNGEPRVEIQGQCAERSREYSRPEQSGQLSRGPERLRGTGVDALAHSPSDRFHGGEGTSGTGGRNSVEDGGAISGVDHTTGEQVGIPGRTRLAGIAGSFWGECDWLPCKDGKYRPVEPGTFPLAHGAPNRVGRLRGYGNAIVAPVAEAFIRAYLDIDVNAVK